MNDNLAPRAGEEFDNIKPKSKSKELPMTMFGKNKEPKEVEPLKVTTQTVELKTDQETNEDIELNNPFKKIQKEIGIVMSFRMKPKQKESFTKLSKKYDTTLQDLYNKAFDEFITKYDS